MSNKQHILEINIFQRVHSADIMCVPDRKVERLSKYYYCYCLLPHIELLLVYFSRKDVGNNRCNF